MVTVRILNNILEDKVDTFSANAGLSIEQLIKEYTDGNSYDGQTVECYDSDTGETYFAPLEDNLAVTNVIVQVNGMDKGLDYILMDNDIVSVIITPSGGNDVAAALIGMVEGAMTGAAIGFAAEGIGVLPGAVIGGVLGLMFGLLSSDLFMPDLDKSGNSKNGLDTKQLPDVRGSQNQPLVDQPYPMVIGKHLATPFIIGSPWNEISGLHGETNYIHALYAVGYAPLRLTDFKLAEHFVSHNQSWEKNPSMNNVFHGLLRGTDLHASKTSDLGDITNIWKNNDISIEILQQGQSGQTVDYGSIYPYAKIQDDVKANVLYIADGTLEQIDSENNITYKGAGLKNGLRNNPVYISEQYARSVQVELDFKNGLYATRSETDDNESTVAYYPIPMFIAVQWRVYSTANVSSDGELPGDDIPMPEWDAVNGVYKPVIVDGNEGHFRGWHTFSDINGVTPFVLTEELRNIDIDAHTGNTLKQKKTKIIQEWVPDSSPEGGHYEEKEEEYEEYTDINRNWIGHQMFNLISLGGTSVQTEGLSEFRCTGKVDFTSWARNNLLTPQEQGDNEILAKKIRAYFYDGFNTTKSIEVRVVRISPCYIDEHISTKKHSAFKFNDIFTWETLTSELYDGNKLLESKLVYKRPLEEEDMRKLCVVALKAKTDNTDMLSNTISKFSCVAQSFAPYYDKVSKKWFPESINTITDYFSTSGNRINEEQFLYDRQHGIKSLRMPGGNDYMQQFVDGIIRTNQHYDVRGRYYIPDNDGTLNYCNNNVASMFLLAGIGPHLGKDALGYEQKFFDGNGRRKEGLGDFNMSALAKWYTWAEEVTDGSSYGSAGYHYDRNGNQVQHEALEPVKIYFAANAYIYQTQTLETLLSKIAIAGRAVYTKDKKNRFTVVIDKPEPYPVALINQQNTLKSSYTISYAQLPSGLQVTFPDENDGYNKNPFLVMADGENKENPKGAIEPYNFDFVTNNSQIYSLGRYLLGTRILNKEVVTKQLGMEGASIGFGNVVLLQDDTMLIGTDTGGRITQLLENETSIFGFLVNNTYKYTGEEEEVWDGSSFTVKCRQGVVIMQPAQFQESRIITLRLARKNTRHIINGKTYKMTKGNTNIVLFDSPVAKLPDAQNGADYYVFKPQVDNLVGFGIVGQETAKYRVVKVKPDAKRHYEFTLIKYQEDLYNYGDVLPSFQNNMTIPDRSGENAFALSNNVTTTDLVRALAEASEQAQGRIDGTFGQKPPKPRNLAASVKENCIQLTCSMDTDVVSNVDYIIYEIRKYRVVNGVLEVKTDTINGSYSTEYYYDRKWEGYPEKKADGVTLNDGSLDFWQFRAKAVSIYLDSNNNRIEGDWSDYVFPSALSLSEYGTWIPPNPSAVKFVAGENEIDESWICDTKRVYGTVQYELEIFYNNNLWHTQTVLTKNSAYVFDRGKDGYPERPDAANRPSEALYLNKYTMTIRAVNVVSGKMSAKITQQCDCTKYKTWVPPVPAIRNFIAGESGISVTWECDLSNMYGTAEYDLSVAYDGVYNENERPTQTVALKSTLYLFDRAVDGYPEKAGTAGISIDTKLVNNYSGKIRARNTSSLYFTVSPNVSCDVSQYKTWIPSTPVVSTRVSNRNITLYMSQQSLCYGEIQYLVAVRRFDDVEDKFYVPDTETNPYSKETAYKLRIDEEFVEGYLDVESPYSQTMPLKTQSGIAGALDTDESEENNPVLAVSLGGSDSRILGISLGGNCPVDTPYQFEVYAFNKTVESYYDGLAATGHDYDRNTYHKVSISSAKKTAIALATSVMDVLNGAVNSDKIADGSITSVKVAAEAITVEKVAPKAITFDKIEDDAIREAHIQKDAITETKISKNAVTTFKIAAGAIISDHITVGTLLGDRIKSHTITALEIEANTITAAEIAGGTITSDEIASQTIKAENIKSNTITTNQIAAETIEANNIKSDAIVSRTIQANAVTTDKLYSYNTVSLHDATHVISGFAARPDTDPDFFQYIQKIKNSREDTVSIDNYIKEHSNNYWMGLDSDHPEFYMGDRPVGQKNQQEANYFHYYSINTGSSVNPRWETNLDIKLTNFIVTAISSTIKGFFNIRNKVGNEHDTVHAGANSFLQVNPDNELGFEVLVRGYLYNGIFYKDAAHTNIISEDSITTYEDLHNPGTYYQWNENKYEVVAPAERETMKLLGDFYIGKKSDGTAGKLKTEGGGEFGTLTVNGSSSLTTLEVSGTSTLSDTDVHGAMTVGTGDENKNLVVNGKLTVTGESTFSRDLSVVGDLDVSSITSTSKNLVTIKKDTKINKTLSVAELTTLGSLSVTNGSTLNNLTAENTTLSSLEVSKGTSLKSTLNVTGQINANHTNPNNVNEPSISAAGKIKSKGFLFGDVDIIDIIIPVGFIYIQFPNQPAPADMYANIARSLGAAWTVVWEDITEQYAGAFFRACQEGRDFTKPETEQLPNISGAFNTGVSNFITQGAFTANPSTSLTGDNARSDLAITTVFFDAHKSNSVYIDGGHVIPYNFSVKIWRRKS